MILRLLVFFLTAFALWADDPPFDPACHPPRKIQRSIAQAKENQTGLFTVDLLIWDACEEGLEYAYRNTQTQMNQKLTSFEPDSKFEPAFRIGVGGFLPYDQWEIAALYTYYHTDRHHSKTSNFDPSSTPGPGMISTWTYPTAFNNQNLGARFQTAENQWKLHCSFLDLALNRTCRLTSSFALIPSFGIRSAWIHQRYKAIYSMGNLIASTQILSSHINMNCASNDLGLLFGLEADWHLGKGWNLFSDISGSVLASHFRVGRRETDSFANPTIQLQSIRLHNSYWTYRPQGKIALGFRFTDSFHLSTHTVRYHLSAAFEAQMWWKQNQFLRYLDNLNSTSAGANVTSTQGDLTFLGADLQAGIDF